MYIAKIKSEKNNLKSRKNRISYFQTTLHQYRVKIDSVKTELGVLRSKFNTKVVAM